MTTKFYRINEFGKAAIYTFPNNDRTLWTKRQIVTKFDDTAEAMVAFNAFCVGIQHTPDAQLIDYENDALITCGPSAAPRREF